MNKNEKKAHWEKVFNEKKLTEVSWYQSSPQTSIDLIRLAGLPKDARIIDVGCGDSLLIDYLIDQGFTNLYALDISSTALERAKERLGSKSDLVNWIVSDITEYQPEVKFDFWHDRAAFHFLTSETDIKTYVKIASAAVSGYMGIGTFSVSGPQKCSGLQIKQYSDSGLSERFSSSFEKVKCLQEKHYTPSQTVQDFTFCIFKKTEHS